MNIFFRFKDIEVSQDSQNFMANRMAGLRKFFSDETNTYIDLERTRQSHHGHDLYYTSIKIDDPHNQYFTEEYRENIKSSFDHAYGEMFRIVRSDRGRARNIARRAGQRIKKLFKRNNY